MGTLTFNYVRAFTGTGARALQVYVNGTQIGTDITVSPTSDTVVGYSANVNVAGNVVLEVRSTGLAQVKLDDISWNTYSGSLSPPSLTPGAGATVDAAFNLTFADDSAWRAAITSIAVGPTTLTAGYSVSAGQITFTPSASAPAALLQTNGTRTITVKATGYTDATVSQTIGAGAATKLGVSTQPTAPSSNGGALAAQPVVVVQDQYGNTAASTATINATPVQATWTLGGTVAVAASAGTATFSGLTATSTDGQAVTGATIDFTSSGLTHIVSSGFNIPILVVNNPAAFSATPATTSQINLAATANGAGNNVVVVYNLTGTFTTPSGGPPSAGGSLAGGTVVYNGAAAGLASHTGLNPATQYFYKCFSYSGTVYSGGLTANATTVALTPPTLTAAIGATVDAGFDVTFSDDSAWRAAITSVNVGPTALSAGYAVAAGQITFTPSASSPTALLQTNGTRTITVKATGYSDAAVSQAIGAGAPNKLAMVTQPAAPTSNGALLGTQPAVAIRDQYGNATTSTADVTASVGAGTWTLGGTTTKAAASGTATFTDLTATSAAAVTGATVTFTSDGLTGITSGTFNIPPPAPSNDNPANAITLTPNAGTVNGTLVSATPMTGATKNDVFYKFVAVGPSQTITINSFVPAGDRDLRIYSSQPANYSDSTVATGTSTSTSSESVTATGLTTGNTYWILVQDWTGNGGTFDITVTGFSKSSDIAADETFTTPTSVAYGSFQTASGLTSGNSLEVARFTVRDGGSGANDPDSVATTLTAISFSLSSSANLRRVALFDDAGNNVGELAAAASLTFSSLSIAATDNGTKSFSLRATFQSTVTDNAQFQFAITSAAASSAGSTFAATAAGGATSDIAGNANKIAVVATKLAFASTPTSATVNSTFSATVRALDVNSNLDLDSTASVTVSKQSGPGTLTGGDTASLTSGSRALSSLSLNTAGNVVLQAVDNGGSPLTTATTIITVIPGPTLFESFADGDFTANPVWSGDTANWIVIADSLAASDTTGSQTLRLNATSAGTEHLRAQITDWGDSQEWGVWLGIRSGQALTAANQRYIWLYANEADLESSTVDGYRLAVGDDTGSDEIRLERISNGTVATTVITSAGALNNGLTDIGFLLRVTRSSAGVWTLYTSALPTANGAGAIATAIPDSVNANINQGAATDSTITPNSNGYLGVAVLHTTGGNTHTEFDQFYVTINHTPIAANPILGLRINESATVASAKLATDSDGNALTVTAASLTTGSGSVSFTPLGITYSAPGSAGSATISYTVSDNRGGTATGAISVTIRSANTSSTITDLDTTTEPGKVILTASGMPSQPYTVQVNDDNAGWVADGNATSAGNGVLRYTNTVPGGVTIRLYRLAQ